MVPLEDQFASGPKSNLCRLESQDTSAFSPDIRTHSASHTPANILDGFRIFCPASTLKQWVVDVEHYDDISRITKKVHSEPCSARRVAELCRLPDSKRDIPFENIQLFNRDALIQ